MNKLKYILLSLVVISCSKDDDPSFPAIDEIIWIPIVVHVLHGGEEIGDGPNLSQERIEGQIRILNEDFRRKEGTRGFNTHPDGGDSKIEFVLARQDPNGEPTSGIVRIDTTGIDIDIDLSYSQNFFSEYSYWNPEHYINIWTTPLPIEVACLALGVSTGPVTDLPGGDHFLIPRDGDSDGILVNWAHFGESSIDCHARFGRTLTHEMGHYLGLLHTWGAMDCEFNDYCDDTPAVDDFVFGREAFAGCAGNQIMIGNYMNYSEDEVMNIFTNDQIERMRYVLQNSPRRKGLPTSKGLESPM
ncbi:MAG: M43 family zinc metalloprotease [Cyclobacteriaceae bacterium]